MPACELPEAQANFSGLIDDPWAGRVSEITILRDGAAVVRLALCDRPRTGGRLGIAAGLFAAPDAIDQDNDLIARMFHGESD